LRIGLRGQGSRLVRCDGRGGDGFCGFLTLGLQGLALDVAHFLFKGALEVGGGFAELGHQFAKATGQFRQLMRPKNDQDDDKQNGHVGHTEHRLGCSQKTGYWHHRKGVPRCQTTLWGML